MYYKLDINNNPIKCENIYEYLEWHDSLSREHPVCTKTIEYTEIKEKNIHISTIFLGLDHSFSKDNKPILWETMVFSNKTDIDMERYSSHDAAIAGHQAFVEKYSK